MRIAFITPLISNKAIPHLGGAQEIIADLAHGLQRRGHAVTLFARDAAFAPGIPTEVVEVTRHYSQMTPEGWLAFFFMQVNLFLDLFLQLQERKSEFDVLHIHAQEWASLVYGGITPSIPVVHTLHLPPKGPEAGGAMQVLHRRGYPLTLVAVSQTCARLYADYAPVDRVIYNGLDVSRVPFAENVAPDAPLLFAGRIVPEKGLELAIEIAMRAGRKLLIAGNIENRTYYAERIAPKLREYGDRITHLGLLKRDELWEVMSQCLGLLFPILWDEPFGMILIEALATGTPVIAFRHGAVEELVRDGETGFIVDAHDCARAATLVNDLGRLQRARCRAHIETHFSLERMIDAYEQVYQDKIAAANAPAHSASIDRPSLLHSNQIKGKEEKDMLDSAPLATDLPFPTTKNIEANKTQAWQPFITGEMRNQALEAVHRVAERLSDPEHVIKLARQAEAMQSLEPFYWDPTSINAGFTGTALALAYVAQAFPGEGWERIARRHLRLAAAETEQNPLLHPNFLQGTAGLATSLTALSEGGRRYQQTRLTLHKRLCEQVQAEPYRRESGAGVAASDYDVISGAAGVLAYLLTIETPGDEILASIQTLLEYLIWVAGTDENGREHWYIPPDLLPDVPGAWHRDMFPQGYLDCGLAHGIPGPLAALSLAWLSGYRLPGQREAMKFLSDWIIRQQRPDRYGINWPIGVPPKLDESRSGEHLPAGCHAAWCYGAPGISRALWLAGTALDDEQLRQTAVEAIEMVLRRPVAERMISSLSLCHGVAGLLTICLRFAHETESNIVREHIPLLVMQLLDSFNPDLPTCFSEREGEKTHPIHPGWLTGVQGIVLALLAATSSVPPDWDHMLLIS